ncbi:MAG: hypothetical protein DRO52_02935, partial [Candidatus Hecatellales archaeon]
MNDIFEIDEGKAVKIAEILLFQWKAGKGVFSNYSMPEYVYPPNLPLGSKEHALYFTYIISIDYMTDAEKLWQNARTAYQLHPDFFTPKKILSINPRYLRAFIKRLGARFAKEGVRTWRKISEVLLEKYAGDPRNITPEPLSIDEIKEKLKDFPHLRGSKLS